MQAKNSSNKSVYGELKLSDKLSDELQKVRQQVDILCENLEESLNKNSSYDKQIKRL